jgi:hypothetical protein
MGGESVKVCVMKAVGIFFFFSLKMQVCIATSLFENTVVVHLDGLVGNIKCQLQQKCKDFMTYLYVADGNSDVTETVLPAVYV